MKLALSLLPLLAAKASCENVFKENSLVIRTERFLEDYKNDEDDDGEISTCNRDTIALTSNLLQDDDYIDLLQKIRNSGYYDTEKMVYNVLGDENLFQDYQKNCYTAEGYVIAAALFYLSEEEQEDSNVCSDSDTNYANYPMCLAKSCEDEEDVSQIVYQILDENIDISKQCRSMLDITYFYTMAEDDDGYEEEEEKDEISADDSLLLDDMIDSEDEEDSMKTKFSKGSKSISTYGTKTKASKSSNQYDGNGDRINALQCVSDMTKIHGNTIGSDPLESRDYQIENLIVCDEETGCIFNNDLELLEVFTEDCEGRVVMTDWSVTSECDDDITSIFPLTGNPECIAESCSDEAAMDFFNYIYFDPDNVSCNADVSISTIMPDAQTSSKASKGSKVVKKVVKKVKKGGASKTGKRRRK